MLPWINLWSLGKPLLEPARMWGLRRSACWKNSGLSLISGRGAVSHFSLMGSAVSAVAVSSFLGFSNGCPDSSWPLPTLVIHNPILNLNCSAGLKFVRRTLLRLCVADSSFSCLSWISLYEQVGCLFSFRLIAYVRIGYECPDGWGYPTLASATSAVWQHLKIFGVATDERSFECFPHLRCLGRSWDPATKQRRSWLDLLN